MSNTRLNHKASLQHAACVILPLYNPKMSLNSLNSERHLAPQILDKGLWICGSFKTTAIAFLHYLPQGTEVIIQDV